ncbi:Protein of unknown function [Formosa sp. Hel1_31_208]|uniref:DUF1573 domain-containing protein n=1 Tax=Formosa sp. Hel1_31_208 TaxID=1798225 RepID=UPI00087A4AEF|nr:DUF1573 domain-containing protein [Formosa sp. Hel1_31_208]SDR65710.1 Protein of unknown function [Formosa sp. Hel1_31_208]
MKSVKTSIILLFFCLVTTISFAQDDVSNQEIGVFEFEQDTIDYGTIQQHDNGVRVFKFTNRGLAPIVISKVKTSCGCTVPTYSQAPILSGESGTIEVKYATNRLGKFSKTLTILSNAKNNQKRLQIKGKVIKKDSKTIK